ncbi:MAG: hypothetical protein ACI9XB_005325 [Gammaproteobacteria bacterium]|jgi:hypothetical protein
MNRFLTLFHTVNSTTYQKQVFCHDAYTLISSFMCRHVTKGRLKKIKISPSGMRGFFDAYNTGNPCTI